MKLFKNWYTSEAPKVGHIIQFENDVNRYVVVDKICIAESLCHNDHYPSYNEFVCKKLNTDGTYNPRARDKEFNFSCFIRDSIEFVYVIGKMKKMVTFV